MSTQTLIERLEALKSTKPSWGTSHSHHYLDGIDDSRSIAAAFAAELHGQEMVEAVAQSIEELGVSEIDANDFAQAALAVVAERIGK